ncbi:MAG: hypothetical protein J6U54_04360 [Clostridiales bacterium]|nr:hypothetical protein [Clostridiales bacterium]
MAKAKSVYTILRYWEENGLTGIDILGSTRDYSDAAKIIEHLAAEKPYADWEAEEADPYDLEHIEIDTVFDMPMDIRMVMDITGNINPEASCRYRYGGTSLWTYADFYIVESDIIKFEGEN